MKITIILFVMVALVVTNGNASVFDWFSKKNKSIKTVDLRQDDAKPLAWLSDNKIAIGRQNSIFLYDIKREALLEKVIESYDSSNFQHRNCFTQDASVFAVKPSIIEKNKNKVTTSVPAKQSYRYISDWKQLNMIKNIESNSWNFNPLDCSIFNINDRQEYIKRRRIDGGFDENITQSQPLLKSIHGESFLFSIRQSKVKHTKYIEQGRSTANNNEINKGHFKQLQLVNNDLHGIEFHANRIESFYDSSKGNYVIYETTNKFDLNDHVWPISAWRISTTLDIVEKHSIPAGPWVEKHSWLKQLSCFSCGCECYSHMKLFGGGGRIYAHVWGKAVDDSSAGIYRLEQNNSKSNWVHLYTGNFEDHTIVSPDGCNIVFSNQNKKLVKIEACNFSN